MTGSRVTHFIHIVPVVIDEHRGANLLAHLLLRSRHTTYGITLHLLPLLVPQIPNENVLDQSGEVLANPAAGDALDALRLNTTPFEDLVARRDDVYVILCVELRQRFECPLHHGNLVDTLSPLLLRSETTDS